MNKMIAPFVGILFVAQVFAQPPVDQHRRVGPGFMTQETIKMKKPLPTPPQLSQTAKKTLDEKLRFIEGQINLLSTAQGHWGVFQEIKKKKVSKELKDFASELEAIVSKRMASTGILGTKRPFDTLLRELNFEYTRLKNLVNEPGAIFDDLKGQIDALDQKIKEKIRPYKLIRRIGAGLFEWLDEETKGTAQ